MGLDKKHDGYTSFSYLEPGKDYRAFETCREVGRVPSALVELDEAGEARVRSLAERLLFVSMHEHVGVFPERIEETPEYARHGRRAGSGP